jgi:hypothetical protein
MGRRTISSEQGAEVNRLYAEYAAATRRAAAVLASKGMEAPEFLVADRAAGDLWRRIRVILGTADRDWLA